MCTTLHLDVGGRVQSQLRRAHSRLRGTPRPNPGPCPGSGQWAAGAARHGCALDVALPGRGSAGPGTPLYLQGSMDLPPGVLPPEDQKLLEEGDGLDVVTNVQMYFRTHGAAVWRRRSSATLQRILRDGLPAHYRGEAWLALSGAKDMMLEHGPGFYRDLIEEKEGQVLEHALQIEKDVSRCVPACPRARTFESRDIVSDDAPAARGSSSPTTPRRKR